MQYDLAIIGSGFAGLAAIKKAVEQKLNFSVVAKDYGATQYFSGAFDVIDPRWQNKGLQPRDYPLIKPALEVFIQAHPEHLYSKIINEHKGSIESLLHEMKSFFDFYGINVVGDCEQMVAVFGSNGQPKPTGCALKSHGLLVSELQNLEDILYINFPFLPQYHGGMITENLGRYFPNVKMTTYDEFVPNKTSPLASLLQHFDKQESVDSLTRFIKNNLGKAKYVFLPPLLGLANHFDFHKTLESELNVRVIELLSVLPSSAGLRLQKHLNSFFEQGNISFVRGEVVDCQYSNQKLSSLRVQNSNGSSTEVKAQVYVLATGKYLGQGISCFEGFKESLFDQPLSIEGRGFSQQSPITDLISSHVLQSQDFMRLGLQKEFKSCDFHDQLLNLKPCGHVLSGFDYTRERCGFGISVASVISCF